MFSFIHTGSQVYLLFQLSLLFFSIYTLQTIVKQRWLKFAIALMPFIPNIAAYSGAIWKDVSFAYSFLLVGMLLTKSNIISQKLTFPKIILILFLLIYGVGVKYQAQFVLPVMSFWLGLTLTDSKLNVKSILIGVATMSFVFLSVFLFNKSLVSVERKQHSWQMVKLYDLAGISVRAGKNLLPEFVTSQDGFSMDSVKKLYSPERVDELLKDWYPGAPLSLAQNEKERNLLWSTWASAVAHHPVAYLSHRFSLWFNMISKSPIKSLTQLASVDSIPEGTKFLLKHAGNALFELIRVLSRFVFMLPFLFFYLFWGIHLYKKTSPYGVPLFMMNLAGLSLLLALFVFSMAADLRYIYLSTCFLFFSHPIAVLALLNKRKQNVKARAEIQFQNTQREKRAY
ncbi:MAG TPA: hypothetical protein VNK03_06465 [Gammaproteobacteria bacterium]|nr:hypothetical protein [Gammaproteobacteria bacterium]